MIKTVATTAGVNTVTFAEFYKYFWIKNTGDTTVYASAYSNVSAGVDNTCVINSGDAVCIENVDNNSVYISGAGSVEIHAQDIPDCSFKAGAKGGELPVASTDTLGGVMVDGTSITADEQGVISAVGGGGLTLLGRYANTNGVETTIGTLTDIPEGTKLLFMSTKITNTTSTIFYLGVGIVPTFVNGYAFSSSPTVISYGSATGNSYTKTLLIRNYGASENKVTFYGSNDFPSYFDIYKLEV